MLPTSRPTNSQQSADCWQKIFVKGGKRQAADCWLGELFFLFFSVINKLLLDLKSQACYFSVVSLKISSKWSWHCQFKLCAVMVAGYVGSCFFFLLSMDYSSHRQLQQILYIWQREWRKGSRVSQNLVSIERKMKTILWVPVLPIPTYKMTE